MDHICEAINFGTYSVLMDDAPDWMCTGCGADLREYLSLLPYDPTDHHPERH